MGRNIIFFYFILAFHFTGSFQYRHITSRPSALAFAATKSNAPVEANILPCDEFVSPIMKVFIEDTDAYGIMYNGNYLRCYDRALHLSSCRIKDSERQVNESRRGVTMEHEGWSIVSMGNQKFISSPVLGGEFVIQGSLKESSEHLEAWDMQMMSPDGTTIFNQVDDLKIAKPIKNDEKETENIFSLQEILPFVFNNAESGINSRDSFTIYRDEIDAHWTGHLPLRNVLNLFERSRTIAFGGPNELQRLQNDGILAVVTSIGDCSLIDENIEVHPGQEVIVDTCCIIKRKGMIMEFYQTLESDCGSRLAQGKVTLMMINEASRRPTSKLPAWLKERMNLAEDVTL